MGIGALGWALQSDSPPIPTAKQRDPLGAHSLIIEMRDTGQCSVEATYRVIDNLEFFEDFMRDVLQPAGDCLGFD